MQTFATTPDADHLLISEVLIDAPGNSETENNTQSSEFVEIFNPTSEPISLSGYILTDYPNYYLYPAGSFDFGNFSDYMLQFPDTAILGPGRIAVVTLDAATFFNESGASFGGTAAGFYAQDGAPLLFEIKDTDASVPEMINLKAGVAPELNFDKTNRGEFVALIYWDGSSDLVRDVDIVRWGSISGGNQIANKTDKEVDGPDDDSQTSVYGTDVLVNHFNFSITPDAMIRKSRQETFELQSGGNGITGHDETSENLVATFMGVSNTETTPGLPHPDLRRAGIAGWDLYDD